jgi:primosomal protein N' (replication factor Y)
VPETLTPAVTVGTVVRVPLRGRRVRGWVVATRPPGDEAEELALLAGVSGRGPVFDEPLLAAARALARRSVHPLSAYLHLITPPQMGRRMRRAGEPPPATPSVPAPPPGSRTLRRLAPAADPVAGYAEAIRGCLATGRSALVVVPEVREGSVVLDGLARLFPSEVAQVHSAQTPAERSAALWSAATGERRVVLGGRAAVLAPARQVGLLVVHAEEDRTLKAEHAPYYDARTAAQIRAACSAADLLVASRAPTVSTWLRAAAGAGARGWRLEQPDLVTVRQGWPAVRVVPPARGLLLPEAMMGAVIRAWRTGARALVLVARRAATAAGPGAGEIAAYLRRAIPQAEVRLAEPPVDREALGAAIVVATEGVLADVDRPAVATALAVGVDAVLAWPRGQAAEHAFGVLWELAGIVARSAGRAGQVLIETERPGHHAIQAVIRADYDLFARREAEARQQAGAPPFSTLVRIRASVGRRGAEPSIGEATLHALAALPGTELLGPVEGRLGPEVLLKVGDAEAVLDPLRATVAAAPERLLVDVDPREW